MDLDRRVCLELTEIEEKKGDMFLSFKYNGQDLGSAYFKWDPVFSTERLGFRIREDVDEKEELIEILKNSEELKPYLKEGSIQAKEYPFRVLNVTDVPIPVMQEFLKNEREKVFDHEICEALVTSIERMYSDNRMKYSRATEAARRTIKELEMPEGEFFATHMNHVLEKYKEKGNKKSYSVVNTIVTKHQSEMMRWELGPIGSIIESDAELIKILEEKKEIDADIRRYEHEFGKIRYKKIKNLELKKSIEEKIEKFSSRLKEISPGNFAVLSEEKMSEEGVVEVHLDSYDSLKYKRMLSAEELYSKKWMLLDIEKPKFGTVEEEVSWVAVMYCDKGKLKKEIYTLHDPGKDEINGCKIKRGFKDEIELLKAVEESIAQENPDIISAYNAKYDLLEMREAKEKAKERFVAGKRGAGPKKDVSTPFFERIRVPGRIVLDKLDFWANPYDYLPNAKLVMIAKEVLGRGGKIINYEQQRELEYLADGSKEEISEDIAKIISDFKGIKKEDICKINNIKNVAAEIIATYVSDDTQLLVDLFEHEKFMKILKGFEFVCNFAKVDYGAAMNSFNSINNIQDKLFFEVTRAHRDEMFGKGADKRAHERRDKELFLEKRMGEIEEKYTRGMFSPVFQAYVPYWVFLREHIASRFPKINEFYEHYKNQDDKNVKFVLSKYGDALANYLIIDFGFYIRDRDRLIGELKERNIDMYQFDKVCRNVCGGAKSLEELFVRLKDKKIEFKSEAAYSPARLAKDLRETCKDAAEAEEPANKKGKFKPMLDSVYSLAERIERCSHSYFVREYQSSEEWFRINKEAIPRINKQMREGQMSIERLKMLSTYDSLISSAKINFHLDNYEFVSLLNHWNRVRRKRANVLGQYQVDVDDVEIAMKVDSDWNINKSIKESGFEVVHKKNNYLYLFGKDISTDRLGDLIITDKIPLAIVADDPSDKRKRIFENVRESRIWYRKNGYYPNFKIEDAPDANHYVYEMKTIGGFLNSIFDKEYEKAFSEMYLNLDLLNLLPAADDVELFTAKDFKLRKKDLIKRSKASGLCAAFEIGEGGDRCRFYDMDISSFKEVGEGKRTIEKSIGDELFEVLLDKDEKTGRHFIIEPYMRKKKQDDGIWREELVHEKRFIMKAEDVLIDKEQYIEDIKRRAECLLDAILGMGNRLHTNHILSVLDPQKKPVKEKLFKDIAESAEINTPTGKVKAVVDPQLRLF